MARRREEWNHPRCWAPPSRYRSAGQGKLGSWPRTAAWLDPDSNHTSRMSVSFLNVVPLQCAHLWPEERIASASGVYHASAPCCETNCATLRLTAGSFIGFPQLSHKNTAIGTPHTRCRERHQSGRAAIIFEVRSSPHAGSRFTFLISSSVLLRIVSFGCAPFIGVSIPMNHCSVARKITGLWQRQQ